MERWRCLCHVYCIMGRVTKGISLSIIKVDTILWLVGMRIHTLTSTTEFKGNLDRRKIEIDFKNAREETI